MNATVTKIVDILFQEVEMSDEVTALKDEVMNNCQERFEDLIANGMEEDEAIAAVVDSLKSMEEVVNEYPKKREEAPEKQEAQEAADDDGILKINDEETGEAHWTFKRPINKLNISLHYEDVSIEPSADEYVHVDFMPDDKHTVRVEQEADTLLIRREESVSFHKSGERHRVEIHMDHWKGKSISDIVQDAMKQATHFVVDWSSDAAIRVQVPEKSAPMLKHWSVSGDLKAQDVCFSSVTIRTTSGDTTLELPEECRAKELKLNTTSGDADIVGCAERVSMQTMSGDVEYEGETETLELSTVSGDVNFKGSAETIAAKTISGDLSLALHDTRVRQINISTTSGDLSVRLPRDLRYRARVNASSVNGDIRNRYYCEEGRELVNINAKSISGDLSFE